MVCSFLLSFFCSAFSHSASFPILSQKPLCVKRRNSPYTYEYRGIPEQSFSRLPAEYPGKTICSHICRLIHLSLAPFFKTAYNCMKEYIPAAAFFLIRVPITAMYRCRQDLKGRRMPFHKESIKKQKKNISAPGTQRDWYRLDLSATVYPTL